MKELKDRLERLCRREIGGDTIPSKYGVATCKTGAGEIQLTETPRGLEAEFHSGEIAGRIDDVRNVETRETTQGDNVLVVSSEDAGVELGEEQTILRM